MNERDILRSDEAHATSCECDLSSRLEMLNKFLKNKATSEGNFTLLQTVAQSYQQILQLANQLSKKLQLTSTHASYAEDEARQILLLSSFGDRLCRRRENTDRALMTGGRGIKLSNQTSIKRSEFFIALNGVEGSGESETLVTLASGIEKDFLLNKYAGQIIKKHVIFFDEERNQFYQKEFKSLWDLPLERSPSSPDEASWR